MCDRNPRQGGKKRQDRNPAAAAQCYLKSKHGGDGAVYGEWEVSQFGWNKGDSGKKWVAVARAQAFTCPIQVVQD